MPNMHLQTQCNVMINSIDVFHAGAIQACLQDDGKMSKEEKKYIDKLTKALNELKTILNKAP